MGGGDDLIGSLIEILKKNGLAEEGLVVHAGTTVAMTTGANLVVKRTVDFVLFCAVD